MGQTDVQEEEHAGVRSTVERFIPRMLTRQLEESSEAGCVPTCFEVECAVLFLDLSGFVSLSSFLDTLEEVDENISSHTGERVRKLLNSYFEEVVDIFISYGGDVLKYAGDAILVAFERETLQESAQAACESALQVQSTLDHYDVGYFGKKLRAKITIACGNLTCLHIGGVGGRWEFVPAGKPISQIQNLSMAASPGKVTLSTEARQILENRVCIKTESSVTILDSLHDRKGPTENVLPRMSSSIANKAARYIPNHAMEFQSLSTEDVWLSEVRKVGVVFVNVSNSELGTNGTKGILLEHIQTAFATLLRCLYNEEGCLRQFLVEDKGVTFIGAFGLPQRSHSNDSERTARASLRMKEELQEMGWTPNIGIACGHCLVGNVGSTKRCEYSVTGTTVNRAARIMANAKGSVQCDEDMVEELAEGGLFEFREIGMVTLKGEPKQRRVYELLAGSKGLESQGASAASRQRELKHLFSSAEQARSGKIPHLVLLESESVAEAHELSQNFLQYAAAQNYEVFQISSERGFGPLGPLRDMIERLFSLPGVFSEENVEYTEDKVETAVAYLLGVLDDAHIDTGSGQSLRQADRLVRGTNSMELDLSEDESSEGLAREHARVTEYARQSTSEFRVSRSVLPPWRSCALLPRDCKFKELKPIVLGLMGIETSSGNDISGAIPKDMWAEVLVRTVIANVLRHRGWDSGLVLIVQNTECVHTLVLKLIESLICGSPGGPILVLLNSKDWSDDQSEGKMSLRIKESIPRGQMSRMKLTPMNFLECEEMIKAQLGVSDVPHDVVSWVLDVSQGQTTVVREVLSRMTRLGIVRMDPSSLMLKIDIERFQRLLSLESLPSSVMGMARAELDECSANAVMIAKVASAIGQTFSIDMLESVMPNDVNLNVREILEGELCSAGLVEMVATAEEHTSYRFTSEGKRAAAYELIPSEWRGQLHLDIAHSIQSKWSENHQPHMLAFHFERSKKEEEALLYLSKAAVHSFHIGAYSEAHTEFQAAARMFRDHPHLVNRIPYSWRAEALRLHKYYAECFFRNNMDAKSALSILSETPLSGTRRRLSGFRSLWCIGQTGGSGEERALSAEFLCHGAKYLFAEGKWREAWKTVSSVSMVLQASDVEKARFEVEVYLRGLVRRMKPAVVDWAGLSRERMCGSIESFILLLRGVLKMSSGQVDSAGKEFRKTLVQAGNDDWTLGIASTCAAAADVFRSKWFAAEDVVRVASTGEHNLCRMFLSLTSATCSVLTNHLDDAKELLETAESAMRRCPVLLHEGACVLDSRLPTLAVVCPLTALWRSRRRFSSSLKYNCLKGLLQLRINDFEEALKYAKVALEFVTSMGERILPAHYVDLHNLGSVLVLCYINMGLKESDEGAESELKELFTRFLYSLRRFSNGSYIVQSKLNAFRALFSLLQGNMDVFEERLHGVFSALQEREWWYELLAFKTLAAKLLVHIKCEKKAYAELKFAQDVIDACKFRSAFEVGDVTQLLSAIQSTSCASAGSPHGGHSSRIMPWP